MELAQQFSIPAKRRELLRLPYPCANFSWEEKAFADDTAGVLGGVVWPPRSYSCSFCNREFRSAQALGGHMNVHRRDRARLKHPLTAATAPSEVQILDHQNSNFSCSLEPPIRSRGSSPMSSYKENRIDDDSIPRHSCSRSFLAQKGSFDLLSRKEEPVCLDHDPNYDTYLSVGLNNSARGARDFGDREIRSCKKPKTSSSPPLFLLLKPCSSDHSCSLQLSSGKKVGCVEDLDLELRLGDPPKVK